MYLKKYFVCFVLILVLSNTLQSQHNEKLQIAVIDMGHTGGLTEQEAITLSNRLRSMLVLTNAFVVLERGQMEAVLTEQGFQQSGCNSTECAVEMGKLLNVQVIVSGSIGKVGNIYPIDISLIDITTAKIERSFIFDHEGELGGLVKTMETIANDIAKSLTKENEMRTGSIMVESEPEDAMIYLDNKLAGKSPLSLTEIDAGSHTIKVTAKGYASEERSVLVKDKEQSQLSIEMKQLYTLSVRSTPSGANVLINNKKVGKTPYNTSIKEGMQFTVKISAENYQEWTEQIRVDDDVEIEETLEYSSGIGKKEMTADSGTMWYWIGGGTVVAGAALFFILSEESTPAKGMPEPIGRP